MQDREISLSEALILWAKYTWLMLPYSLPAAVVIFEMCRKLEARAPRKTLAAVTHPA